MKNIFGILVILSFIITEIGIVFSIVGEYNDDKILTNKGETISKYAGLFMIIIGFIGVGISNSLK